MTKWAGSSNRYTVPIWSPACSHAHPVQQSHSLGVDGSEYEGPNSTRRGRWPHGFATRQSVCIKTLFAGSSFQDEEAGSCGSAMR